MARHDILLDDDNELIIQNGDFVVGQSDDQNAAIIFEAQKGEIRSSPELGFGARKYIKKSGSSVRNFLRDLKLELEKDGYNNPDINLDQENGTLTVKVD